MGGLPPSQCICDTSVESFITHSDPALCIGKDVIFIVNVLKLVTPQNSLNFFCTKQGGGQLIDVWLVQNLIMNWKK